jgi:hypothetical protein
VTWRSRSSRPPQPVETFGARNTHWVSARIDPTDPNLFVFEPRIVPQNAQ